MGRSRSHLECVKFYTQGRMISKFHLEAPVTFERLDSSVPPIMSIKTMSVYLWLELGCINLLGIILQWIEFTEIQIFGECGPLQFGKSGLGGKAKDLH